MMTKRHGAVRLVGAGVRLLLTYHLAPTIRRTRVRLSQPKLISQPKTAPRQKSPLQRQCVKFAKFIDTPPSRTVT
jgi:hypothetical protein